MVYFEFKTCRGRWSAGCVGCPGALISRAPPGPIKDLPLLKSAPAPEVCDIDLIIKLMKAALNSFFSRVVPTLYFWFFSIPSINRRTRDRLVSVK